MKNIRAQPACANCKHSKELGYTSIVAFPPEDEPESYEYYCLVDGDSPKRNGMDPYEFEELRDAWREDHEVAPHMICDLYVSREELTDDQ